MTKMFLPVRPGTPKPGVDRAPKAVQRKYPLDTTPVGGSFFVPGRSCKSVSSYISRISKDFAGKFSARRSWAIKQGDEWVLVSEGTAHAVSGVSVWRDA